MTYIDTVFAIVDAACAFQDAREDHELEESFGALEAAVKRYRACLERKGVKEPPRKLGQASWFRDEKSRRCANYAQLWLGDGI